jgi:hypothetical protein
MDVSLPGHQLEWGTEAENLCGKSSLSKYQHCLLGKNMAFTFISILFSPSAQMSL